MGAGLQRFLCTLGDFLTSFSGVAEIVKAADQQFGGLAYGTVVLLATGAVLKQKREETIENTLEELSHAFPRLNTFRELQPGPQLEKLIVSVFELSILFCREGIAYFARSSRILEPLKTSSSKMETVSKLRLTLLEIRKECDLIMPQKLEHVRLQLQDVRLQLREASTQLEEIRNTSNSIEATGRDTNLRVQEGQIRLRQDAEQKAKRQSLLELKSHLKLTIVEEQPVTTAAAKVKKILADEFSPRKSRDRGVPKQMSGDILMQDEDFQTWLENEKSSMLILAGSDFEDDASIQLNCLSAASVWAAEVMRSTTHVLAVFCQTSYTITDRTRRTYLSIMKTLIYQLAEYHVTGLDLQHHLIREALVATDQDDEDHLSELFFALIEHFPVDKSIVLIIDRLDQCRGTTEAEDGTSPVDKVVLSLLHIMRTRESLRPQLRILLVMDAVPAKGLPNIFQWAINKKLLSCRVDWDQEIDE